MAQVVNACSFPGATKLGPERTGAPARPDTTSLPRRVGRSPLFAYPTTAAPAAVRNGCGATHELCLQSFVLFYPLPLVRNSNLFNMYAF